MGKKDVKYYAEEALRYLHSAWYEHDFRKRNGDYGIKIGWELTAGDMLTHMEKAREAVKSIVDLMETAEQLIGMRGGDDDNG